MFYDVSFTIPANTTKAAPLEQHVKLSHGVIHRVEVGFPSGCAGLAHLQILEGAHHVWPTNPAGSFNTDDYTIPIDDYYELFEEPYTLTLVGWNEDDTFSHTLEVRFGILPAWVIMASGLYAPGIRSISPEALT